MKRPQNYVLIVLASLVVIVGGFSLWKTYFPTTQKTTVRKTYGTTAPIKVPPPVHSSQTTPSPLKTERVSPETHDASSDKAQKWLYENVTSPQAKERRWLRTMAKAKASYSAEELAKRKRYFEVLESPGYLELVRNGAPMEDRWNFMADAGIDVTRNVSQVLFKEVFPSGDPADYEPEMRAKLSTLIAEKGILDLEVVEEFSSDLRARHWIMGYFRGDFELDGEYTKWLGEVAVQTLTSPPTETVDRANPLPTVPSPELETNMTEDSRPQPSENPLGQIADQLRHLQQQVSTEVDTERPELPPVDVLKVPETLTEQRIETALREHFSPERFTRAMKTLNQYGPKEGLRRLKESDPEVAKRIERLLPKEQENEK